MSDRPPVPSAQATAAAVQFVTDLMAGRHPSIEAALDTVQPAEWPVLLQSLLTAEVNYRRSRGECPVAREYLPRFPAHADMVRQLVPEVAMGKLVSVTGAGPPEPVAVGSPAPAPPAQPTPAAVPQGVPLAVPYVPMAVALPRPFEDLSPEPESPPPPRHRSRKRRFAVAGVLLLAVGCLTGYFTLFHGRSPEDLVPVPKEEVKGPGPLTAGAKAILKLDGRRPTDDPERDLAEWVIAVGGRGTLLLESGGRRPFTTDTPLPRGKFEVTGVFLPSDAAERWGAADLERLRGRSQMGSVQLHHPTALSDATLEPLHGLPLRVLELSGQSVRVSAATVARFPDLESLSLLSAPDFTDADLTAVRALQKLTAFAVDTGRMTSGGFRQLNNPQLRSLTFGSSVVLSPDHIRVLQALPLEVFESRAGMTDDVFLEFAVFPNIRRFDLRQTRLTDAGLKAVSGLGKLEVFTLIGSGVTGPGLEFLAERPGLRVLDLSRARLTDDAVGPLIGLPALRELRLAGNPLTDRAVNLLAQIDTLQVLDLGETQLTDMALGILKKHQSLKTLIVTGTRVTPAAARDFEAATPGCKVILGPRP